MKSAILLITITTVLGGKCPPKEIIAPCECVQSSEIISCQNNLTQISKAFESASRNLGANEKHFREVHIFAMSKYNPVTLEDSTFGDITFETFHGLHINKIGSNTFNRTSGKLKLFYCITCELAHEPSKYDLLAVFDRMIALKTLSIGLNITEIPSDVIVPVGPSKLNDLYIKSHQGLTIRTSAFQNLEHLYIITFTDTRIHGIEKEAFKFIDKREKVLTIKFEQCKLTGESFHNGAFDGTQSQLIITFVNQTIDYLNEGAFKSILNQNQNNFIDFSNSSFGLNSKLDCDNCKNSWLIKFGKEKQVKNAHCKSDDKKTLFDKEIRDKLSQKCKL